MLIPIDKKPDWHNPPIITLLLIIANIFCFTLLATDNTNKVSAFDYYLRSELPRIEIPVYIKYLDSKHELSLAKQLKAAYQHNPDMTKPYALQLMLMDGGFQRQLAQEHLITPDQKIFPTWHAQHENFMRKLNLVASYRFSLKAYHYDAAAFLSHLFLHADLSHLLWNMFFLFIFGFIVEASIGHLNFFGIYILSGLISSATFVLVSPDSGAWNMGASGAIAGLVGMYAILYGRRRIQFFYTLLFYFDYIRAPAYILLPVWLGYEIYSQFTQVDNINNLIHISGLIFGAIVALLIKRYLPKILIETPEDDTERSLDNSKRFAHAMSLLENLHLSQAKTILDDLNRQQENLDWLYARYTIAKYENKPHRQAEYINRILALDKIDASSQRIITTLFDDLKNSPELFKHIEQSSIRKFGLLFVQWNEDDYLSALLTLGENNTDTGYQYDTIAMIITSLQSRGKEVLATQFRKHLPSIVPNES